MALVLAFPIPSFQSSWYTTPDSTAPANAHRAPTKNFHLLRSKQNSERVEQISGVISSTAWFETACTDTALLQLINIFEEAEETESTVCASSFDCQRAFDSLSTAVKLLTWTRLGVTEEWATLLTELEVRNVTIVRTPWAWHHLRLRHKSIKGQRNPTYAQLYEQLPPGISFNALRGNGQGDIPSAHLYCGWADIICRALQLYGVPHQVYLRDNSYFLRVATGQMYVDDLVKNSPDPVSLQQESDVVCAGVIVSGLTLQPHKVRCFGVNYGSESQLQRDATIIMRKGRWEAVPVPLQSSGSLTYLGINIRLNTREKITASECLTITSQILRLVQSKRASTYTKWRVVTVSTFAKIIYKGAGASMSIGDHEKCEQQLRNFYRRITLNLRSFPTALLHMGPEHCGLGLPSLNDKIQLTKYNMLFRCLQGDPAQHTAASGLLERIIRQQCPTPVDMVLQIPCKGANKNDDIFWADSLIHWLHSHSLTLARGGYNPDPGADSLLAVCGVTDTTQRDALHFFGVHVLSDIINYQSFPASWVDFSDVSYGPHSLNWLHQCLTSRAPPQVSLEYTPSVMLHQCWAIADEEGYISEAFEILGRLDNQKWILRMWGSTTGRRRQRG